MKTSSFAKSRGFLTVMTFMAAIAFTQTSYIPEAHAGFISNFREFVAKHSSNPFWRFAGWAFRGGKYDVEIDLINRVLSGQGRKSANSDRADVAIQYKATPLKVSSVNTPTHTSWDFSYDQNGLKISFFYDDVALQNPHLLVKDLILYSQFSNSLSKVSDLWNAGFHEKAPNSKFEMIHQFAELMVDAQIGSPAAKLRLAQMEIQLLSEVKVTDGLEKHVPSRDFLNQYVETRKQELPDLELKAKEFQTRQQRILDKWKTESKTLDLMEEMPDKLNDLILNNDRKGVANMIRTYLPWALMEPVEADFWKVWLEAIENPDTENTRMAFRGLDFQTDKVQRRMTEKGEIYGFMSTVLTQNQGSYTRRLRSLSTNRLSNGDADGAAMSAKVPVVKIMDQFLAHAKDPKASSFLSFTYDPEIANRFIGENVTKKVAGVDTEVASGGMLAVKVDARRMIPNAVSMYNNEVEVLAPLVIFPDEVVGYHEGTFKNDGEYKEFIKHVAGESTNNPLLGAEVGFLGFDKNANEVKSQFQSDAFRFLQTTIKTPGTAGGLCSHIW